MPHNIDTLYAAGFVDSNVYIVTDEKTNYSLIVDPDFQYIKAEDISEKYDLKLILLTHAHFDHIASAEKLRDLSGAKIMIHELDSDALQSSSLNLSTAFGFNIAFKADECFKNGDIIKLGETEVKILHTPGHTKGSSCFIIGNDMISGDMLFNYSIGRTDFPGGSAMQMRESIKLLKEIDTDFTVYPGHGESTTLFFEKENNPYFYSI